ncbi:hypothetical protein SKAU_G00314360 [Synaphobranchus kaupii]|uniref:Uncharacterized protein n=1 Tax=Synaphobranchus kaupii TaxID=118154 RepID=A0A9Q1ESE5_SYNKA|nr:hypothetical protein SKAU_G00314360 [Synaphobranchus kaupii]
MGRPWGGGEGGRLALQPPCWADGGGGAGGGRRHRHRLRDQSTPYPPAPDTVDSITCGSAEITGLFTGSEPDESLTQGPGTLPARAGSSQLPAMGGLRRPALPAPLPPAPTHPHL